MLYPYFYCVEFLSDTHRLSGWCLENAIYEVLALVLYLAFLMLVLF